MAFEQQVPPMPIRVDLSATLRETGLINHLGRPDEIAVARVDFYDFMGETRTMDFTPELAMDLLRQLATFVTQVGCQGRP